jgi:DNA-binding NarL/FixJ family response regulator
VTVQPITPSYCVPGIQPITVVIVDDHPPIRHSGRRFLECEPDIQVLNEAESGNAALELMRALRPDVLILEHRLPDMSSLCMLDRLRSFAPSPRVLIYTGYTSPQLAHMLLHAGASGFAVKTTACATLVHAVRQVAHGQTYISPCVAHSLAITRSVVQTRGIPKESLSKRDFDVIRLLAEGLDNLQIAKQLGMGERTVRQHGEKICGIVGLRDRCEAIAWAAANGFGRLTTG